MKLKELKEKRWFKIFTNIYILISSIFIVWMLFFDANSWWFTHRELNDEIEKLQQQQLHLEEQIYHDKKLINQLKSNENIEKFAREKYYYKKENEEIYLIEFDTLQ